ncbi:MAG: GH3 auxin-responsive promoter family protein [Candidatus Omnitrophota bacterium]
MNIASLALKTLAINALAFEESTKAPIRVQRQLLLDYLKRNGNTKYGKECNFSEIKTIETFQKKVPLSNPETVAPYTDRMTRGEANVLTSDKPIFFGLTSGTTSHPKFIPVTKFSRSKKADVTNLWAYYIYKDHPRVLDGKILAIVNSEIKGYTECGIPYGAETGHGYKSMPDVIKHFYAIPYEVFDIKDYDARYYCILRIAMEQDITTIATPNPGIIVLLCQKLGNWQDRIIEDIENGTIYHGMSIEEDKRKRIEECLRPNSDRANFLKTILKEKKTLLPKYCWPNLELIECWKGGTLKMHLKELSRYFGDIKVRDFGYLSTEARCSIPMTDEGAGGVLAINTNFYEFIPREDLERGDKRFLLCDQLKEGMEYSLVLTTPGGLYRYDIGDIIRINGFFNKTPIVEFVQRGQSVTNLAGEKLYGSQVNEAVNRALDKHKLLIQFYSASIQWGDIPRYIFLIEFNSNPPSHTKESLLVSIEEELCQQNIMYEDKRRACLLAPPILKVVKKGGFEKYRAKKVSEGANDSQFKVPELIPDLNFQKNFNINEEISLPEDDIGI